MKMGMNYAPSYLIHILRDYLLKQENFDRKLIIYLGRENTTTRKVINQDLLIGFFSFIKKNFFLNSNF